MIVVWKYKCAACGATTDNRITYAGKCVQPPVPHRWKLQDAELDTLTQDLVP